MSRSRNYFHAVWSGYLATAVASLVNLLTIPIALSTLGKSGFGLWSAVMQVAIFSNIFDAGLGPSMARFMADYKAEHDRRAYAGFLKSIFVVTLLQGLLFAVSAVFLIPVLPSLMGIPPEQAVEFRRLLVFQLGATALSFPLRPLIQLLFAHQQIAWQNGCTTLAAVAHGAVVLCGLKMGYGIYTYPVATWVYFVVLHTGVGFHVFRCGLIPPLKGANVSLRRLKPLASFSANVFFIAVGLQLISFAPGLLITRKLGVRALADWTVGTRLMLLALQLINRMVNSSEPIFWEMYVQKEIPRLRERFLQVLPLVGAAAALFGGGIAAINPSFIQFWTAGRVEWQSRTDICLVSWLVLVAAATVLNMVPGMTKQLGAMKYVYALEGLVPAALAYLPGVHWTSQWQVALLLVLCVSVFRLPYGLARTCRDAQIPISTLLKEMGRLAIGLVILAASALALRYSTTPLRPLAQLVVNGTLYSMVSLAIAYKFFLPPSAKPWVQQFLRKTFPRFIVTADSSPAPANKAQHNDLR
jgi:O-antigen/teichoic acid export membrane protein